MKDWRRERYEAGERYAFQDYNPLYEPGDEWPYGKPGEKRDCECSEEDECRRGGGCNPENCSAYALWREGCGE